MRLKAGLRGAALGFFGAFSLAAAADAQGVGGPGQPWRGAGPQPCFGADSGVLQCPEAQRQYAIRAARLFDSNSGTVRTNQVVLVNGDRNQRCRACRIRSASLRACR